MGKAILACLPLSLFEMQPFLQPKDHTDNICLPSLGMLDRGPSGLVFMSLFSMLSRDKMLSNLLHTLCAKYKLMKVLSPVAFIIGFNNL